MIGGVPTLSYLSATNGVTIPLSFAPDLNCLTVPSKTNSFNGTSTVGTPSSSVLLDSPSINVWSC